MFSVVLCTEAVQSSAHIDEQFLQFSGLGFVTLDPCILFAFLFYTT